MFKILPLITVDASILITTVHGPLPLPIFGPSIKITSAGQSTPADSNADDSRPLLLPGVGVSGSREIRGPFSAFI